MQTLIPPPYSGDQFGYYTVGDKFKTYSKLEAIEEMARTGIHLEWHFNKPYYESFDWKKEPAESLDELYRRRAQEIRDRYDYIVLWTYDLLILIFISKCCPPTKTTISNYVMVTHTHHDHIN